METISEVVESYFENLEKEPPTEQEIFNKQQLLNHWIKDKSSGRAHFGNVPNDCQIDFEWVQENLESVNRIIEVRKECKRCSASSMKNCPYNEKQKKKARDYEREKGLDSGALTPDEIKYRPTLTRKHNKLFFSFELCPVGTD